MCRAGHTANASFGQETVHSRSERIAATSRRPACIQLADQLHRESGGEAHDKHGRGYYRDQVNGPGMVAFTDKVDVPRAALVSINVKMHSSGLRLRTTKPPIEI
jgi:hypothetical protein